MYIVSGFIVNVHCMANNQYTVNTHICTVLHVLHISASESTAHDVSGNKISSSLSPLPMQKEDPNMRI